MGWQVKVRAGAGVSREAAPSLAAAVALAAERARVLAAQADHRGAQGLGRRYEAADLVAARVELRGPQRWRPDVRAGFDVRGDGSLVAWTQGAGGSRSVAEPAQEREDPVDALRRALGVER